MSPKWISIGLKMKTSLIISLFLFVNLISTNEEINEEVTINGVTFLYGKINREGLTSDRYNVWFKSAYDRYQFSEEMLSQLKEEKLKGLTVKLFMGTWCGDSQRNVPVFYKFMDRYNIAEKQLEAHALDLRKQGPENEQQTYGISRVPTIIFYRKGKEIGRFIERPQLGKRLEELWVEIINRD